MSQFEFLDFGLRRRPHESPGWVVTHRHSGRAYILKLGLRMGRQVLYVVLMAAIVVAVDFTVLQKPVLRSAADE